ncbi:MAG: methyltransferase domain-containing protein [bacterium]
MTGALRVADGTGQSARQEHAVPPGKTSEPAAAPAPPAVRAVAAATRQSDHYSYRVYQRPEIARDFDRSKFSGEIGQWIADGQEQVVRRMLAHPVAGRRILDVGVGTGRLALPLARDGARVVGIDASPLMLGCASEKSSPEVAGRLALLTGDAHDLPFGDRAFDSVVCLRVLMHVVDWKGALAELCRVADRNLVFDVPPRMSFARLDPVLKRLLGTDEQVYRTFSIRALKRELIRNGFEVRETHREYVLPIAFHRKLRRLGLSKVIEGGLAALGLRRLMGAPATIHATRRERLRVLMIAPQPYFSSRGTPFSVRHRLEALSSLGAEVDLVTYHVGQDVPIRNVRIHRIPALPGVRHVRVGPSWIKIPLDALVAFKALGLALRNRYHLIQGHEEAGLIGALIGKLVGVPHLYDMHSSLPEQLDNYGFTRSRFAREAMRLVERTTLEASDSVIAVCPSLVDIVNRRAPDKPCVLIENRPPDDLVEEGREARESRELLDSLAAEGARIVLYTGTLEVNQGLDLLLDSFPLVLRSVPKARLVLVGGEQRQVAVLAERAAALGIAKAVILTGQRPLEDVPAFMRAADVLVSTRSRGQNSPLKLYSYLKWGRPIVATDLYTHTQVLDATTACLTPVTPDGIAAGIVAVLEDATRAAELAKAARARYTERYSWERYLEQTRVAVVHAVGSAALERAAATAAPRA